MGLSALLPSLHVLILLCTCSYSTCYAIQPKPFSRPVTSSRSIQVPLLQRHIIDFDFLEQKGGFAALIGQEINSSLLNFTHFHDGLILTEGVQHQRDDMGTEIGLDSLYLDRFQKTMELILLNATSIARDLLKEIEGFNIGNKPSTRSTGAVIEDDFAHDRNVANYTDAGANYTYKGITTEIEAIIKDILNSRGKANILAKDAAQTAHSFQNEALKRIKEKEDLIQARFEESAESLSSQIRNDGIKRRQNMKNEQDRSDESDRHFLNLDSWTKAGYIVHDSKVSEKMAQEIIKSISLESFRLRNDAKRDQLVVKSNKTTQKEARTRKHIGVRDWSNLTGIVDDSLLTKNPMTDSNILLHYNLGALSNIGANVEKEWAKVEAIHSVVRDKDINPRMILDKIRAQLNETESFESLADFTFRIVVLETKVDLHILLNLVDTLKYSLKEALTKRKSENLLSIKDEESLSLRRIVAAKTIFESERFKLQNKADFFLLRLIDTLKSSDTLLADTSSSVRELRRIVDEADSEAKQARKRINAETVEERKQEKFSLEKIKLAGEEASKSVLEMIETLFHQILRGLSYIISNEDGRYQAFMFVFSASLLALSIFMSREAVGLIFYLIKKSMTSPRLVRERGRAHNKTIDMCPVESQALDVVLQENNMKQVIDICNIVRLGSKRNAPQRYILLHGRSGTGKSMTARAIATASNLPYAIMSGADIAPLQHLGPSEFSRVLCNCKKSGSVLIIDEAESALGKRLRDKKCLSTTENHSESTYGASSSRDALNVFLSMTGETGGNMMLILTTSNPSALDEAVLDRCDHIIECSMPTMQERKELANRELNRRFQLSPVGSQRHNVHNWYKRRNKVLYYGHDFDINVATEQLSSDEMTFGFSGRELSSIIRAVQTAAYSDRCILTKGLWNKVVHNMCASVKAKRALK